MDRVSTIKFWPRTVPIFKPRSRPFWTFEALVSVHVVGGVHFLSWSLESKAWTQMRTRGLRTGKRTSQIQDDEMLRPNRRSVNISFCSESPQKSSFASKWHNICLVDTLYVDFSSKLVIILAAALLIFNGVLYWSGTYPFSNVSSMSSIPAFKANDNRIVLASHPRSLWTWSILKFGDRYPWSKWPVIWLNFSKTASFGLLDRSLWFQRTSFWDF